MLRSDGLLDDEAILSHRYQDSSAPSSEAALSIATCCLYALPLLPISADQAPPFAYVQSLLYIWHATSHWALVPELGGLYCPIRESFYVQKPRLQSLNSFRDRCKNNCHS